MGFPVGTPQTVGMGDAVQKKMVSGIELDAPFAPLGEKPPDALETVFSNSKFKCFAY